jgi:hypothetical protein
MIAVLSLHLLAHGSSLASIFIWWTLVIRNFVQTTLSIEYFRAIAAQALPGKSIYGALTPSLKPLPLALLTHISRSVHTLLMIG